MIDRQTVQQILDAVDIVDVVSDFVTLKRRGANYVGLCPFHNEKTPSFSVSRSKGICKCFSCSKGGSAVNFIMEHEQISYYEALKYLAKKYHIEVKERELTPEEVAAQSKRESMLNVNEAALAVFEHDLHDTTEGHDVGLSYFLERGMNEESIKKFHLGYSLDSKDALFKALIGKGFDKQYVFETGLCTPSQYGSGGFDRFKGRVMFPVFNLAGKVIAFGGRTLKNDPAKYVNSPESEIYKKSRELYGMFQAKHAIAKLDKCFLVEGYMDVISMVQSGIENVVASSGTSLTEGQIRMIHRFTNNVTVLYDGDSAGIKAAIRGIDMLLAEGLNIKILLLPDGHDPDSFAKSHSSSEFQKYIEENETDFIKFKTRILLNGVENDPIKKSAAIQELVKTISVIPVDITRAVYAKECSRYLDIDENLLVREISKAVAANKIKEGEARQKEKIEKEKAQFPVNDVNSTGSGSSKPVANDLKPNYLEPYEKPLLRYIVKYGMNVICASADDLESGITVLDYISRELDADSLSFTQPVYQKVYSASLKYAVEFQNSFSAKMSEFESERIELMKKGIDEIGTETMSLSDIEKREKELAGEVNADINKKIEQYRTLYLETLLCSDPDDDVRTISTELVSNKYKLSKIHSKYAEIPSELSRLETFIPEAICNLKNAILNKQIAELNEALKATNDAETMNNIMMDIRRIKDIQLQLNTLIGERVLNPKK